MMPAWDLRPTMHVLAGPNGTGKTTLYRTRLADMHPGAPFVNADELAHQAYGHAAATAEESRTGQRLAAEWRDQLIGAGRSFVTETTFSHPSKIELIETAREQGYRVVLYHVHVRDPELSVQRVAHRVTAGGHPVPEDKIRERFARNPAIIRGAADRADRTHVLDNSRLAAPARRLASLEYGRTGFMAAAWPDWACHYYDDAKPPGAEAAGADESREPVTMAADDGETTVELPVHLVEAARQAGGEAGYATAHQLRRWLRLGWAVDTEPTAMSRIQDALAQHLDPDGLNEAEREVFEDQVGEALDARSEAFDSFLAERRARAPMVGYDEQGRLVREHPDGSVEALAT